jgi:exosome complex component MTR3
MAQPGFDRRRVNGPEESFPPVFNTDQQKETLLLNGKRKDGRTLTEVRPICMCTLMLFVSPNTDTTDWTET